MKIQPRPIRGRRTALRLIWCVAAIACLQGADWPTFGHEASRSASNVGDRVLTAANVRGLRERWRVRLDAVADSTPIVVGTMLFQTTKNGTTNAIDASTGHSMWRFVTHGPNITTSIPAFDPAGKMLYVPGLDGFVHKLDWRTGREVKGAGFPARVTMAPATEKIASPLNVANGYLYAVTSGYLGDPTPYVGHVMAIRLRDGASKVFNVLCSGRHELIDPRSCRAQRAGIWARSGAVVDPDPSMGGRVYVATGNGDFNAHHAGGNYGDSVIALSADASHVLDYYTPRSYAVLESTDTDLGSTSPALLPREARSTTPLMALQGGKDQQLRLLDRAHLGGLGRELQSIDLGKGVYSAPAIWSDPRGQTWIYLGLSQSIHAYRLVTTNGRSHLVSAWIARVNGVKSSLEGSSPVADNDVVFAASSGELVALEAQSGRRLWSSTDHGVGHSIGAIHWQSPVVVNGTVYCSDEDGYLTAYSLR
jgi:outer membrane protein assembly factor BamB